MSPRRPDPKVRAAFIEAAAHLLSGPEPLTLRRLAAEVGTSTMAVYTHFGSMDELMRAVRHEGFERLAAHLAAVPTTKDPVADLLALGWAYCVNAVSNPSLYGVMFVNRHPVVDADVVFGAGTFLPVVTAIERCIRDGRLSLTDAWDASVQLWGLTHGMVTLALGGIVETDELLRHLQGGIRASLIGYGGDPAATDRSVGSARRRMLRTMPMPPLAGPGPTLSAAVRAARRVEPER